MAQIGFYSFPSLTGRLQVAGPGGVVTYRGIKRTKPVARPSTHISTEHLASLADAWTRARAYRSMIGSWQPVIDGGGLSCPGALVCDVRCFVSPGAELAELETAWTLIPHGSYLADPAALLTADPSWRIPVSVEPVPAAIASAASRLGAITAAAMYGDAQWPLQVGQVEAMQRAADDLGLDGIPQPSTALGSVTLTRPESSETTCAFTMRTLRSYVGSVVMASLAGVSFPCVVRDVDVTWAPTPGLPDGDTHTLTAVVELSMEDDATSGDDPGASVAVVQVASKWGREAYWQDVPGALCVEADEGLSGVSGVTSFTIDHGATSRGQRTRDVSFADYTGKWIRIQVREMEDGTPSVRGAVRRNLWWGKCLSYQLTGGRGMSAASVFQCAGLDAALQEIAPTRWYAIGQVLGVPAQGPQTTDPGSIVPLNSSDNGNAAVNPGDVLLASAPQPASKLPESRAATGDVTRGTGTASAQMILAALNHQTDGPRFVLSDATNALSFDIDEDLDGPRFGDLLGQVINVRHGVAYALEVDDSDPTHPVQVKVYSTVQAAVNLPNGTTIPANASQIALDLAAVGSPNLDDPSKPEKPRNALESWTVTRSRAGEADSVLIEAGHPVVAVTVGYKDGDADAVGRMIKGWSSTEETAWDAAGEEARNTGPLQHVWRRFRLGTKYAGGDYADGTVNYAMRAGRQLAGDVAPDADLLSLHGAAGETGVTVDLLADGKLVGPKPAQLKLTRYLPWPENFNWADPVAKFGVVRDQREQPARVRVFGKGGASNSYEDLSYTWDVDIDEDDGAVILGRNAEDALAVRTYLKAGKALLFTVGIVAPIPWRVSWRRPDANRPCDWRRSVIIRDPSLTYWVAAAGTVTSVNDDFTARMVQVDDTYDKPGSIDGVQFGFARLNLANVPIPRLSEILALTKTHYENQTPTIEWTRRGLDFSAALKPGPMVTTVALALDDTKQISLTMNANITGRRWRFLARELATSYATDRLMLLGSGSGGGIGRAAGFNHVGAVLAKMGDKYQ
jgi:hypothetical protein